MASSNRDNEKPQIIPVFFEPEITEDAKRRTDSLANCNCVGTPIEMHF